MPHQPLKPKHIQQQVKLLKLSTVENIRIQPKPDEDECGRRPAVLNNGNTQNIAIGAQEFASLASTTQFQNEL